MNSIASDPTKLSPARIAEQIDTLAGKITRRGLAVPAVFMLEMHKPLTGIAHTMTEISAPLISLFAGNQRTLFLQSLLDSSENIEKLICAIESKKRENKSN